MIRLLLVLAFCCSPVFSQTCLQHAEEIAPPLTRETRREFETKLAEARKTAETDPSADNLIWLGRRRFLYNGERAEAEKIFRQIILGNQWASFGHIAAEAELSR